MGISYSVEADPETTAKAMLRERHVSFKHSKAIAREIKGMTAGEALTYLEGVVDGDEVVPFREHNAGVGHRNDIDGWDAGRFPESRGRKPRAMGRATEWNTDEVDVELILEEGGAE